MTPEFAFQWIKNVKKGCKFNDFNDSEGFETLDIKLATALKGIVPRQLGRQIALKEEEWDEKVGTQVKGRQILVVILDWYQENEKD